MPGSQLYDQMHKPGFHDHHDHFKNSTPESEYKSCLEYAEKIGIGTRDRTPFGRRNRRSIVVETPIVLVGVPVCLFFEVPYLPMRYLTYIKRFNDF